MHENEPHEAARFTALKDSTAEDWKLLGAHFQQFAQGLPDRILEHLKLLNGDFGGFPVDRLQHSLQTATLAHQAGEDEEYVVCALLHDIGIRSAATIMRTSPLRSCTRSSPRKTTG